MEYQKKFDDLINVLKSSDRIKVGSADIYVKEEIIPQFFKKNKILKKLENEIKVLNDNMISWSYKVDSGDYLPMGESHLISIEEVMGSKVKLWGDHHNENEKKILSELKPFDDHPEAGDGLLGCLRFQGDEHEIWFYNENSEYFKMNIDISGYLEKLIQLKAIFGWQYLFLDLSLKKPEFKVVREDLKKRLKILNTCFPDNSLNVYLKKL